MSALPDPVEAARSERDAYWLEHWLGFPVETPRGRRDRRARARATRRAHRQRSDERRL